MQAQACCFAFLLLPCLRQTSAHLGVTPIPALTAKSPPRARLLRHVPSPLLPKPHRASTNQATTLTVCSCVSTNQPVLPLARARTARCEHGAIVKQRRKGRSPVCTLERTLIIGQQQHCAVGGGALQIHVSRPASTQTHTDTHRHTQTHTDTHRHTQTHTDKHRHTHRQTQTHADTPL